MATAPDPRLWAYPVLFKSWIDGDSARILLDLGLRTRWEGNARIAGINCPELRDEGGYEAWKFAEQLVPPGTTRPCRSVAMDSFGRPLLAVDLGTESGFDGFATEMLTNGHAVVYERK